MLTTDLSLQGLELTTKLITPPLLYFFARHLIRSEDDLRGVLTTFLYSAAVPFSMLLYEHLFATIGVAEGRGDLVRFQGGYADVLNYAIYVVGTLLAAGYLFMQSGGASYVRRALLLLGAGALCLLGVLSIHHAATWTICGVLVALFVYDNLSARSVPALLMVVLAGVLVAVFVGDTIRANVATIFEVDLEVIEGGEEPDRAFHGRVGRWKRYFAEWQDMSLVAKAIGAPIHPVPPEMLRGMLLSGIHNDYMRIGCASGLAGLTLYLGFYLVLLLKTVAAPRSERFLIRGMAAVILLFSVTTSPTLYAPLTYLGLPVFAYATLLPSARRSMQERPAGLAGAIRPRALPAGRNARQPAPDSPRLV